MYKKMLMRRKSIVLGLILLGLTPLSLWAQWSIGAPGTRQAPQGKNRAVFLVYANPVAGKEVEFNDWYLNVHLGDLVQTEGWAGAQRFRIVPDVEPRPTSAGYKHGYIVIWDLEDTTIAGAFSAWSKAFQGGKIRLSKSFDFTPGGAASGVYNVMTPRILRPDGQRAAGADPADARTPRPGRYMLMEFSDVVAGKEAEFNESMSARINAVLAVPGFMAAQRFQIPATPTMMGPSSKPRYLTIWEIQSTSVKVANDALIQATKEGKVKAPAHIKEDTHELVYWEPISPYITKEDFNR